MTEYEWYELYEARFGKKLTKHEIEIWDSEIKYQIKNCMPYEIMDAIRELGEQKRKGELKYNVTANHLISEIIKGRFQVRSGASDDELCTKHDEEMNRLKSRIRSADTDEEKWDIICEPMTIPDCTDLERFAKSLDDSFKRPKFPSIYDMVKNIGK